MLILGEERLTGRESMLLRERLLPIRLGRGLFITYSEQVWRDGGSEGGTSCLVVFNDDAIRLEVSRC